MTSKVLTCEIEIKRHCHKRGWKVKIVGSVYVASVSIGDDDDRGGDMRMV